MKLIVTIDTEEDNWGDFRRDGWTLQNIDCVPALQGLFESYGVIPTYMVTYAAATGDRSRSILREISQSGKCEIGAHCHPWHTPPLEETMGARNSMLCNLPPALQHAKIRYLHAAIQEHLGVVPKSFRSGRWGYGPEVALALVDLDYAVDSSIAPYCDWTPSYGPDFSGISPSPFRFSPDRIYTPVPDGPLLEVPATIGYAQPDFSRANRTYQRVRKWSGNGRGWVALLRKLGVANRIWLSPETSSAGDMIQLARVMMRTGHPLLNMVLHSPALAAGLTPFVRTPNARRDFLRRIETFLRFTRSADIESIALSEAVRCV